jgi:hypothetical protein
MVADVRAALAKLVALVLQLEAQHGVLCHVHATVHQHGNDGGESACVLVGCDRELPELPALLDDERCLCSLQSYPVCRRRHQFQCQVATVNNNNNNNNNNNVALVEPNAAVEAEPAVDFVALAASCKTSEEILKMVIFGCLLCVCLCVSREIMIAR